MAENLAVTRREKSQSAFAARLRDIAARQNRVPPQGGRVKASSPQELSPDPIDRYVTSVDSRAVTLKRSKF